MTPRNLTILGRPVSPLQAGTLLALGAALLWSYWPNIADMVKAWRTEPEYSHGFLVPLFALVLLWFRRSYLENATLRPSWWGLALIALAVGLRLTGVAVALEWFEQLSLLPFLAGLIVLLGGWGALRWSWPSVLFLGFMIPLPWRLKVMLANPLQRFATVVTTYVMQTIGLPALSEGNTIIIGDIRIEVIAACSGLSMLVVFFALSTAVAIVIRRPLGDRLVIFFSAIPIAVISNVIRITVTGLLHVWVGKEIADLVFHDLAGWLMMPMALGFMWLELKLISWLLLEPSVPSPTAWAAADIPGSPRRRDAEAPAAAR
ncbi:MAG TPA: exosortase/archaeosortase family protein [Gemmataceae bacterium]|nr:exosortase/archaeosortase family protein [Gemmataceae bacterium]